LCGRIEEISKTHQDWLSGMRCHVFEGKGIFYFTIVSVAKLLHGMARLQFEVEKIASGGCTLGWDCYMNQ
jgi:hypothetical protein